MKYRLFPYFILSIGLLPSVTFGAITISDTLVVANATGSTEDADGNSQTRTVTVGEIGSFNANGVSKLVVALAGEGSGDNTVTSVTYGGDTMLKAIDAYGGNRGSSIWYLDNVSVTGTFVITHAVNQNFIGLAAYALNGTAGGFNQTASTGSNTGDATYNANMAMSVSEGDFMVLSFTRNNSDFSHDGTGGRPAGAQFQNTTQLYYRATGATGTGSGSALDSDTAASGYHTVTAGDGSTFTPLVYDLTNGAGRLTAATFSAAPITAPIPEPSIGLLGAIGAGLLLRRRRN